MQTDERGKGEAQPWHQIDQWQWRIRWKHRRLRARLKSTLVRPALTCFPRPSALAPIWSQRDRDPPAVRVMGMLGCRRARGPGRTREAHRPWEPEPLASPSSTYVGLPGWEPGLDFQAAFLQKGSLGEGIQVFSARTLFLARSGPHSRNQNTTPRLLSLYSAGLEDMQASPTSRSLRRGPGLSAATDPGAGLSARDASRAGTLSCDRSISVIAQRQRQPCRS